MCEIGGQRDMISLGPLVALAAVDAASGGASNRDGGRYNPTRSAREATAVAMESATTCRRLVGSGVAPSRSWITTDLTRAVESRREDIGCIARNSEPARADVDPRERDEAASCAAGVRGHDTTAAVDH
jgi:hypothetical protein